VSEFATALTDTVILDEGAAFETFVQFSFGVFVLWSHTMLDGAKSIGSSLIFFTEYMS